jgi:hypothetical protein
MNRTAEPIHRSADPPAELADSQTPTSYSPLGAKGIGEAGSIGSTPAVQNAIIDALAPLGVRHIGMPASRSGSGGRCGRPSRRGWAEG